MKVVPFRALIVDFGEGLLKDGEVRGEGCNVCNGLRFDDGNCNPGEPPVVMIPVVIGGLVTGMIPSG